MNLILYGIKNCNTVKKARDYLEKNHLDYQFHDFKKAAITKTIITHWLTQVDWQTLLNKRGLTWRRLPDNIKNTITTKAAAISLMLENPSIIKRPVLDTGKQIIVGFDETVYSNNL